MTRSFSENDGDKLTCQSCGQEFACGANAEKCWCFEIDLNDDTLAKLNEQFNKCLCRNCLTRTKTAETSYENQ